MGNDIEALIKKFNIDVDNYITTLNVLKLFGHEMCCTPGTISIKKNSVCWCGRRMTTSNKVKVTPDLVIKIDNTFGAIAEIKNSLSRNQDYWVKHFNQLLTYDDDLKGWEIEHSNQIKHDIILLVPHRLHVFVKDYIEEKVKNNELHFKRPFAAISFHREDKVQTFYCFQKFFGNLSDSEKNEELRTVANVPSEKILPYYDYCFCDEAPPLPYTMDSIWSQIGFYIDQDALLEGGDFEITINYSQLLCDLKQANSPLIIDSCEYTGDEKNDHRNPSYPKSSWIKAAIKEFLKLKYFENHENGGQYKIQFKKYKRVKSPLEEFKKKIAQSKIKIMKKEKDYSKQLPLNFNFKN